MPEPLMQCGNCRFFKPGSPQTYGLCRRLPPVCLTTEHKNRSGYGNVRWRAIEFQQPTVDVADWCGEWRRHV